METVSAHSVTARMKGQGEADAENIGKPENTGQLGVLDKERPMQRT